MSLGSKSTCSTSLTSESFAGGGELLEFLFSAEDFSLGFWPEGRSRVVPGLSSGVVKSSVFPRTFVVSQEQIARVLAVKVANMFLNSSIIAALAGALATDTFAAGVWRLAPLPQLKGVFTLSASSVDMSG
ncbi:hypothetical protein F2Q68_00032580 [Brassica cretica]|uniref:Uncharacterized protein n=1 Tax=Brassica cretica TaxID=69181 RepID=A0A8S9GH68_BRACR|nr:hypothetical protein F2Q68_00032580 [Brassica cretica]